MSGQRPTSREHYVPRVYLKGFASDDKRLYYYDLNTRLHSKTLYSIETICVEKNLYEYRNSNNEIIFTNRTEIFLGRMEKRFTEFRNAMRERVKVVDPHTQSFLTDDEKAYWLIYITFQILRLPKIIDEVTAALQGIIPSNGDENSYRNTALYSLLPSTNPLKPDSREWKLFSMFYDGFDSMKHTLAYDKEGRLFTSDCPVYTYAPIWYAPSQRISNCEKLIFPIDDSLCFIFSREGKYPDNGFISIDDQEYESICKSIAYSADKKLFIKRKFTKQEKEWINIACTDKQKDQLNNGFKGYCT